MEKKNVMTREEFKHFETIDAMYDMYLSVVTGFNRLVDICNDGSERIAELVIERDNLSKGVQKLIGERDELTERHKVYTNALNKDIADKAAKIDLLEKEIEGRKEGYIALKVRMDTKYISIDDHNDVCKAYEKKVVELKKEIEKWQDLAKINGDTIRNQYDVCEDFKKKITELENEIEGRKKTIKLLDEKVERQRENLNALNKTLEIRTKENERLIAVKNNQDKEIEAHESENARLSEKIIELKKERDNQMARVSDLRMELDCVKASKEKHEEAAHDKVVEDLRESFNYWRTKCLATQEENEKLKRTIEKCKDYDTSLMDSLRINNDDLKEQVSKLKKELDETYKAWNTDSENHQKREMTLVDEIAKKNRDIEYYKNQERIRTDRREHWRRSYFNIRYSLNKLKDESKEDDHGRKGFKEYIEWLVKEEEEKFKESWKARLNEELEAIFKEEEETEVKSNGRTSSGRYPWGAKVNDIPCGEDAIE